MGKSRKQKAASASAQHQNLAEVVGMKRRRLSASVTAESGTQTEERSEPESVPIQVAEGNEAAVRGSTDSSLGNNLNFQFHQSDLHLCDTPAVISSVHSEMGAHVSNALKSKIVLGRYIDLALLLDTHSEMEDQKHIAVDQSGQLVLKSVQPSRSIQTIEAWTDAFLIYASIFVSAHPHRIQEVMKYMSVIRTAAKRHSNLGWKQYDQQFRLRLEADPSGMSFNKIDYELWLLYVGRQSSETETNARASKKCFDFNYRQCFKPFCLYRHACLICNNLHPSRLCTLNKSSVFRSSRPVRTTGSQGQRHALPQSLPGARPRFPSPITPKY